MLTTADVVAVETGVARAGRLAGALLAVVVVTGSAAGGAAAVIVKVVDPVLGTSGYAAIGEPIVEAARVDRELTWGEIPRGSLRVVMVMVVMVGTTSTKSLSTVEMTDTASTRRSAALLHCTIVGRSRRGG